MIFMPRIDWWKNKTIMTLLFMMALFTNVFAADEGPYNIILSWTGDTAVTQSVSWTIAGEPCNSYVKYIEKENYSEGFNDTEFVVAEPTELDDRHIRYEANMEGLEPETRYMYIVGSDETGWSEPSSYTTGSNTAESFSFIYLGDAQFSDDMESDNAEWGDMLSSAYERNPDLSFGITGGDMVNSGKSLIQWESILDNASPLFSKIPLMTAAGNHECFDYLKVPSLYMKLMALPANGPEKNPEEFYSFDYANTHVTVLNSSVFWQDPLMGDYKRGIDYAAIKDWISEDLAGSNADNKIVVLHHPPYKIFDDDACDKIYSEWIPIFESEGVDLVFCGHQHQYMRTYPMYQGSIDYEKGITYIMGFSGSKTYAKTPVWYAEKEIGYISTYQIITINGDGFRVTTNDIDGNVLDKYYISEGFRDVSPMNWFADYIGVAVDNGILSGTSSYTFEPRENMTRAMMATMLARLDDADTDGYENNYWDVPQDKWYSDAILWASANKIVSGVWHETFYDTFAPALAVTREQMAVMVYNYAQYKGFVSGGTEPEEKYFGDSERIADWAEEAVSWCVRSGLLKGRDDGCFYPKGTATRAEVAVLASNYLLFEAQQNHDTTLFTQKISPAQPEIFSVCRIFSSGSILKSYAFYFAVILLQQPLL